MTTPTRYSTPLPYSAIIETPLGHLGITTENNSLTNIDYLKPQTKLKSPTDDYASVVVRELKHYFTDARHSFSAVKMNLMGTPFQKQVWQAMTKIPCGKIVTYGDLATQLATSPRAIGNACRQNPIPIIVPCHRIVAKQGLGGYSGATKGAKLDIKAWLLQHENVAIS